MRVCCGLRSLRPAAPSALAMLPPSLDAAPVDIERARSVARTLAATVPIRGLRATTTENAASYLRKRGNGFRGTPIPSNEGFSAVPCPASARRRAWRGYRAARALCCCVGRTRSSRVGDEQARLGLRDLAGEPCRARLSLHAVEVDQPGHRISSSTSSASIPAGLRAASAPGRASGWQLALPCVVQCPAMPLKPKAASMSRLVIPP